MRADPEVTADWTPAQLGSVLIHHVCHLLRTHGERAQGTGCGRRGRRLDPRRRRRDQRRPGAGRARAARPSGAPPRPAGRGRAAGRAVLRRDAPSRRQGRGEPARSGPCLIGLIADPARTGSPARQGEGGLPRWQADLLRRQVAQDVIAHGKQPGTVPAGLLRWAEEVLSRRSTGAPCSLPSCAGPSPRSPGRSTTPTAAVAPVRRGRAGRAAGPAAAGARGGRVCDTSGSMTRTCWRWCWPRWRGCCGRSAGPAGPRAGLRHRGGARAAGEFGPPGRADRRRRDGHGRGHRRGGRAAAQARGHGRAHRRYTPWPRRPEGMRVVVGLLGEGRRRRRHGRGPCV